MSIEATMHYHQQHHDQITTPYPPPPPKFPLLDLQLAEGSTKDYINICLALRGALSERDWKAAEVILHQNPELIRYAITPTFDTPLHCATKSSKSKEKFVEKLVHFMDVEDLEQQNKRHETAFCLAARAGNVKIAKIMLRKNKSLLEIPDIEGMMPLHVAADDGKHEMVRYLYEKSNKMTTDSWTPENRGLVLKRCVQAKFFDVALEIVNDHPDLTSNKKVLGDVLLLLAVDTDAFKGNQLLRIINSMFHVKVGHAEGESNALKLLRILKEKMVTMPENEFNDILKGPPSEIMEGQEKKTTYRSRLLFNAAEWENTRFILELIELYPFFPDLILMVDDKGRSIFHVAVQYREAEIYNLLHEIGPMKELITQMKDVEGNTMLHLVAKSSETNYFESACIPGNALDLQQELLWFEDVKQMMPPAYRQAANNNGETPNDLFTRKQHHLAMECEKYFLVLATILAFTAAYVFHRGYNLNRNIHLPMFHQRPALIVIGIASAISLIFSSTSVLIYIAILTSIYTKLSITKSLHKKGMLGLVMIFLSLGTMLIAWTANLFFHYNEREKWIPITGACFTGLVILFNGSGFYLAFGSKNYFKPRKHMS